MTDTAGADIRQTTAADLSAIRGIFARTLEHEPVQRAALADLLFGRPGPATVARVAVARATVVGCVFASRAGAHGYVDGFAVHPGWQRQGIATRLLAAADAQLRAAGANTVAIGGNTDIEYAWPGIDLRYAAALSLVERVGYRRTDIAQNMTVDLAAWIAPRIPLGEAVVRRAVPADRAAVDDFVSARFVAAWSREARRALSHSVPTIFLAVANDTIIGFACHGVHRVDWFGPIGVDADLRGGNVGHALLAACLTDMAGAGIAAAQIAWIGPAGFYRRTVQARCERAFAIYVRE